VIAPGERSYIAARACVPEHLPAYVSAITGGEPHLFGDFLVYTCADRLIFVGYPLSTACDETAWLAAFDAAIGRFRPRLVSITAAALPPRLRDCPASPADAYYRLDLADVRPTKKVRNLLRRASREVTIGQAAALGPEHRRLVTDFLATVPVDEGTRFIFERLERYAGPRHGFATLIGRVAAGIRLKSLWRFHSAQDAQVPDLGEPLILEARNAVGRLAAFDIAAFGGEYGFYLFNFRARERYVPGASDLLLARLMDAAQARGKRYLNLGLGINPGVAHFKEKWGAMPFLAHVACVWERPQRAWEQALDAL